MTAIPAPQNQKLVRFFLLTECFQSLSNERNGLVPGDLLPASLSSPSFSSQWMPNSVRIIEHLKAGLTFRTEPAFVNGVVFYPFEFDRPVIDRANPETTAAGALKADAGGPLFIIRHPFPIFRKGMEELIGQSHPKGCGTD
jgi:hypothetical protein